MGAMRKMAVYLGLVEDEMDGYADEHDYVDYDEPTVAHRPVAAAPRPAPTPVPSSSVREVRPAAPAPRPTSGAPAVAVIDHDLTRITTVHPRSYNDARRIGEEFRSGTPVIINLTDMDDSDAKRIVDFSAGLIFALHGGIARVTNKVFLLSPANVDVSAEARKLAEDGFFNQS